MSEETKHRIIEAGAELIHQHGFNNTGLKDILKAADVPKGSFYFYFDSKEIFGIEMVDYYAEKFRDTIKQTLDDKSSPPLERLHLFFDAFHAYFESQGFTRGCPIGNLAQEMSDLSEPFRTRLKQALDSMTTAIRATLDEAQKSDDIPPDLDPQEAAIFIIGAWHGAIVRMKVTKSGEPLNLFSKFIFDKLLK